MIQTLYRFKNVVDAKTGGPIFALGSIWKCGDEELRRATMLEF